MGKAQYLTSLSGHPHGKTKTKTQKKTYLTPYIKIKLKWTLALNLSSKP